MFMLMTLLGISLICVVTSQVDSSRDVWFTLHVRVGESLRPYKLVVFHNDTTAKVAAMRFCQSLLHSSLATAGEEYNHQANVNHCIKTLSPGIERRMLWAQEKRSFMPVPHQRELLRSVDFNANTPRFNANSPTGLLAGVEFLRHHGYAVFKDVATSNQVSRAIDLMWDYLESLSVGIRRDTPHTWDNIPANEYGILLQFGIGQSDAMWYIRTLPIVHKVFAAVWGTDELIVDFGGAVIFRPLVPNCTAQKWRTAESWFHTDQNARSRPGMQTVQGAFMMTRQTPETGGLVVVPESWKHHEDLCNRATAYWGAGDDNNHFLLVPPGDELLHWNDSGNSRPRFVNAEKGDLVLWDSRLVHCNTIGTHALSVAKRNVAKKGVNSFQMDETGIRDSTSSIHHNESSCKLESAWANITGLKRLAALVSMAPRSMATETVLAQRWQAVRRGQTTTHWPFLFVADDPGPLRDVALSPLQKRLIGYVGSTDL